MPDRSSKAPGGIRPVKWLLIALVAVALAVPAAAGARPHTPAAAAPAITKKTLIVHVAWGTAAQCYWPTSPGWHWSPGYMGWFWYQGSWYGTTVNPYGWARWYWFAPYGSSEMQNWASACPWP